MLWCLPFFLHFFIPVPILVSTSWYSNVIGHLTFPDIQPLPTHPLHKNTSTSWNSSWRDWPLKSESIDSPETLVTNYQARLHKIPLRAKSSKKVTLKVSTAFMLRIRVFCIVTLNTRIMDSWNFKRTCHLIFRGWGVLNPWISRWYIPTKCQQSIMLLLNVTSQKIWILKIKVLI